MAVVRAVPADRVALLRVDLLLLVDLLLRVDLLLVLQRPVRAVVVEEWAE